jgi:hypothetical protein
MNERSAVAEEKAKREDKQYGGDSRQQRRLRLKRHIYDIDTTQEHTVSKSEITFTRSI